jgi:ElaB/YqjD/DUF883 family membrane-anchored ribosome-binding protein
MTKRTAKQAKRAVAESASGLQGVIDSADELLDSLRDQQGEAVDRLRTKIAASVKAARDRLEDLDVPELASDAVDSTTSFLRSDPWRTVAIGALAALAVSLIVRSSSH